MKKQNNLMLFAVLAALIAVGILAVFFLALLGPQGPVIVEKKPPVVNITGIFDPERPCSVMCPSVEAITSSIRSYNVSVNLTTYAYNSSEGMLAIAKYNITQVPSLIVTRNILGYQSIARMWANLNATRINESFVLYFSPPFRNLTDNRLVGFVNVVFLGDSSCTTCYDVSSSVSILENGYNVAVYNRTYTDVSHPDAKELIARYNITKVPTFVMSPDAAVYSKLMADWPNVGSREADGFFVLRNLSVMGTYRDLKTGKIVNATV